MKKCGMCGSDCQDQVAFCPKCGSRFEAGSSAPRRSMPQSPEPRKSRKGLLAAGFAVIALLIAVGFGGGILVYQFMSRDESAGSAGTVAIMKGYNLKKVEQASVYVRPELEGQIDLYGTVHQPAARDLNGKWDKSLFYRLEDADASSQEDNQIVNCSLERTSLVRTDNGNRVDYEIYRDPESKAICKIVSIEQLSGQELELTDYYYQDGSPNFIFRRSDSAYTPSYASIDKVGERYYFNQDQMVKWRWIYEPQVVKQWILGLEDTGYTQWAYPDISQDEQRQYDEKEQELLNAAYNTYAAIERDTRVDLLEGIVLDESGKPMEGVWVAVGDQATGAPFVKQQTGADGRYAWEITDPGMDYFLIFQKEGCTGTVMEPLLDNEGGRQIEQEQVTLYGESKESFTVDFDVVQMAEADSDLADSGDTEEAETPAMPSLSGAEIEIRWGINHVSGVAMETAQSDQSGKTSLALKCGTYTATVKKEGYIPMTAVFSVKGDMDPVELYCMKELEEGIPVWTAVLTWENRAGAEADLDSTMFIPQKGAAGNMVYINTLNRTDSQGNRFLYDGKGEASCEVIQLTNPEKGSYRYYVNDYERSLSANEGDDGLRKSNAVVRVYKNGQLAKTFRAPAEGNGVIWGVFEIRNDEIIPVQHMYGSTEGKGWWIQDKAMAGMSDLSMEAGWIQSDEEWLYFVNPYDENKLYYCRKDGSELTKLGEDCVNGEIVLVGDTIYYMANSETDTLCSIRYDGSGRTELESPISTPNSDGINSVAGYYDGILYTHVAPGSHVSFLKAKDLASGSTWFLDIPDSNAQYTAYNRIQVVGEYVYFAYGSVVGTNEVKFCRQELTGGQTEVISTVNEGGFGNFTILKGWIYFGFEDGSYRMKMDGSQMMKWDNSDVMKMGVIDGESYRSDCKVYDADGNYIRDMFDITSFNERNARAAYQSILQAPVVSEIAQVHPGYFAVIDINSDGISELLYTYPMGSISGHGGLNVYGYESRYKSTFAMTREITCNDLVFDQEKGRLISYSYGGYGISNLSSGNISGREILWEEKGNTYTKEDLYFDQESYDEYMNSYNNLFKGKPLLQFVENNQTNQNRYLAEGAETGFVDPGTIDWLQFTPDW